MVSARIVLSGVLGNGQLQSRARQAIESEDPSLWAMRGRDATIVGAGTTAIGAHRFLLITQRKTHFHTAEPVFWKRGPLVTRSIQDAVVSSINAQPPTRQRECPRGMDAARSPSGGRRPWGAALPRAGRTATTWQQFLGAGEIKASSP